MHPYVECTVMQATDKHGRFDNETQEYLSDLFANTLQTLNELQEEADFYEVHDEDVLEAIILQEGTIEKLLDQLRDEDDEVAEWLIDGLERHPDVSYRQIAQVMIGLDDAPHTEQEVIDALDAGDALLPEVRDILRQTREDYDLTKGGVGL